MHCLPILWLHCRQSDKHAWKCKIFVMTQKAYACMFALVCVVQIGSTIGGAWLAAKSKKDAGVYTLATWMGSALLQLVLVPWVYRGCKMVLPCFVAYRSRVHVFIVSCMVVYPYKTSRGIDVLTIVCFALCVRIALQTVYGVSRRHIFKKLNTGHNTEVLQLEKYLMYTLGQRKHTQLSTEETLQSFYKRGAPKCLPLMVIFDRWKRTEKTEGSVYEEYGYDVGESLKIPNRPRLTPEMEEVEGAISVSSLMQEFGPEHATKLFGLISYNERSRVRYSTFAETFRQISLERSNLYYAVKDCRKLLVHFHNFLLGIEVFLISTVFSIVMEAESIFLNTFIYFCAVHLVIPGSISFCESFIFLLVSHPYDNGDRVLIKGMNMIVKKVGLFETTFAMWSGTYVIIQNTVISKLPITNIRRSISQYWTITLSISIECSNESILKLKKRLHWYVKEEKMLSGMIFAPDRIDNGNAVQIRLLVRKNSNFQNGFFTLTNYTKCMACIVRIVTEEGLYYKPPVMRTRITDTCIEDVLKSGADIMRDMAQHV